MNGTNAPFGLRPTRTNSSAQVTEMTNQYYIADDYNTAINYGDPVTMLSDGTIGIGVAGSPCLGMFAGCKFQTASPGPSGLQYNFSPNWPASQSIRTGTVCEAMVIDSPDVVFEIQESNGSGAAGTPLALADRNLNINLYIPAGNALGYSQATINNASENTTPGLNMKILDLAPIPGNVVGNFAVWLVMWNNHLFKGGAGTTGI